MSVGEITSSSECLKIFTDSEKSQSVETVIHKGKASPVNRFSRKRKSANLNESRSESDDNCGLPLAESTVLKKRRNDSNIMQKESELINLNSTSINPSNISKRNVNAASTTNCKFVKFLHEAGIQLNSSAPHTLCTC